jgi:hypothetical protein
VDGREHDDQQSGGGEGSGYRSSRRTSKARKKRRVEDTKGRAAKAARGGAQRAAFAVAAIVGILVVGYLAVIGINGIARWNALRNADSTPRPFEATVEDNVVVIGVADGDVEGFLALGLNEDNGDVVGVGIPGGAFMEVPGQGFQRVEDSLVTGADVSADAISNFLGVRFDKYAVIDAAAYQTALQGQDLTGVLASVEETNMSEEDLARFAGAFDTTPTEDIVIVPLPVRPISLGEETYFEPELDEVADLIETWWGVDPTVRGERVRVIVYNGAGVPGIAGEAAQALITEGFRVVETRNADNFDHDTTEIYLYHGDEVEGERVREVLGVGQVSRQDASQDIADIIVIVGADFVPPETDG